MAVKLKKRTSGGKASSRSAAVAALEKELRDFHAFGAKTRVETLTDKGWSVPVYVNEFWTSRQRAAHSLHEVSYRACFKPQLPRFFIERLTQPGDRVFDPFLGRGTTVLEAALLGRGAAGTDINPLSRILVAPRFTPPRLEDVEARLAALKLDGDSKAPDDLLAFYHPQTLRELGALRATLAANPLGDDPLLDWIRMVTTNRLTGHSSGSLSVYTLPPNQAVSVERQRKINAARKQQPEYRDIRVVVMRKSRSLLKRLTADERTRLRALPEPILLTGNADSLTDIPDASVSLVVTSPPFLDVVQYRADNWLRCWFNNIPVNEVEIWNYRSVPEWSAAMERVFHELARVVKPGGHIAFEVGEVRSGKVRLEEHVIPAASAAGLTAKLVLVNAQDFTKTANCWGVKNREKGTNTNRVVLLQR